MGYYRAGGYYRGGGYYRAGGLLSGIGKLVKGATGIVGGLNIPVVSGVARAVSERIPVPPPQPQPQSVMPGAGMQFGITTLGVGPTLPASPDRPVPGVRGAVQRILPGGASGYYTVRRRHINPGNAKAARRAIRRINSVRKLLMSIERQLPRRPAPRTGSRGVITRSEAARALRR